MFCLWSKLQISTTKRMLDIKVTNNNLNSSGNKCMTVLSEKRFLLHRHLHSSFLVGSSHIQRYYSLATVTAWHPLLNIHPKSINDSLSCANVIQRSAIETQLKTKLTQKTWILFFSQSSQNSSVTNHLSSSGISRDRTRYEEACIITDANESWQINVKLTNILIYSLDCSLHVVIITASVQRK